MKDRTENLYDLDASMREMVGECEVTGRRTLVTHDQRPVAVLISWDEYCAMKETLDITANPALMAEIETADQQARRGELILPEDLGDS